MLLVARLVLQKTLWHDIANSGTVPASLPPGTHQYIGDQLATAVKNLHLSTSDHRLSAIHSYFSSWSHADGLLKDLSKALGVTATDTDVVATARALLGVSCSREYYFTQEALTKMQDICRIKGQVRGCVWLDRECVFF